jgi:transcriptional regulator GlxA family with amidase domain
MNMTQTKPAINVRNVAILLFDDIEVLDFAGPFEVFSVAGSLMPQTPYQPFFTYTMGLTHAIVNACGGLRVQPKFSLDDAPTPHVLIVPGGSGSRRLLVNDRLLAWLRQTAPKCEIVAAVCTGALVLAAAGLAKGKRITTHHDAFDRLNELEPSCIVERDERFVRNASDKNEYWFSGGISAGIDMSLAIVTHLLGDNKAVVEEMEWMWHTN